MAIPDRILPSHSQEYAPLQTSPDELYQQFIEAQYKYIQQQQQLREEKRSKLKENPNLELNDGDEDKELYSLAHEFEALTGVHFDVMLDLRHKRSLSEDDSNICKKLELMLKEERNSWRLIKALLNDQLLASNPADVGVEFANDSCNDSDRMDESIALDGAQSTQRGQSMVDMNANFSEEQIIGNFYTANKEIRRMQLVCDWLEANDADEIDYKDVEDKVEFYSEGPIAWENTFHAMKTSKYNINIYELDVTANPNVGLDLCTAMDPDAPIRTKKSLVHTDKEAEIRLFKHLYRFIRAGQLEKGQQLARRIGYHWLSACLDGWLPYSDPNLDMESLGQAVSRDQPIMPVSGNRKRDVWKLTCFRAAKIQGLAAFEKAILGVYGGNLRSVLPVCHTWADQLWARLKCSMDVKIERALRDPNVVPQENRRLVDYPSEFYEAYENLNQIFESIQDLKFSSPDREATIHQTVQRFFILNDFSGLLDQLKDWCINLDFVNNFTDKADTVSPQFLRFFTHIVLYLREINLITAEDVRGTLVIETFVGFLTRQRRIESVAHYTTFLPRENQIMCFARLLAKIDDRSERKQCIMIAKDSGLEVDEITQTVVELVRDEQDDQNEVIITANATIPDTLRRPGFRFNTTMNASTLGNASIVMQDMEHTKTSLGDKRKIDSLDYLLFLDQKNYVAILHHGNILMRHFALQRKMDALKELFLKLPTDLAKSVEDQWKLHTNNDITLTLRNNIRELDSFRALLEAQEELSRWTEWHHKRPEEPKKPANLTKFCDNVNYEQSVKQYQQDLNVWKEMREQRTEELATKITSIYYFPEGWMRDIADANQTQNDQPMNESNEEQNATETGGQSEQHKRLEQTKRLRQIFIPHMTKICFNVLQLSNRYEDCLRISHLLVQEDLRLHESFSKAQIREFLDKVRHVTKILVKKTLIDS